MNLIVDIGNTLVKLAVFDGGRIVAQRCVERLHPSMLGELLEGRRNRMVIFILPVLLAGIRNIRGLAVKDGKMNVTTAMNCIM